MRYFVDTPMYGLNFMCARVSAEDTVEVRQLGEPTWRPADEINVETIEVMSLLGLLEQLDHDPFEHEVL